MQVDPIKPTLKAPGTKRLKLKCDKSLSKFAFKFNLRRCIKEMRAVTFKEVDGAAAMRDFFAQFTAACKVRRCRLTIANQR